MKSKLNFKIKHEDGHLFDMYTSGLWVESFHVHSPNVTRITRNKKGRGKRLKRTELEERQVDIGLQVETDNMINFDQLKHEIFFMFYSEKPIEIIRDLMPDKKIYVLQEGDYDIDNITPEDGEFNLTLMMLDPFVFGQTNTLTVTPTNQLFEVTGQSETPWTSETTFKAKTNKFELEASNGLKIILNYEFIPGDVLTIDANKRDIFLNGKDLATAIALQTEWDKGEIKPGEISIKATHETVLKYDERYY